MASLAQVILPAGIDRISSADFRKLLAGQGGFSQAATAVQHLPAQQKERKLSPDPYEHDEQVAFVTWLRSKGIRHNATPNGGHRAAKTAKYLKAEGVSAGFPDITIWPELGSGLPVLYIEMKRGSGGVVSENQDSWLKYLACLPNTKAVSCKGATEAIRFVLEAWGMVP